MYQFQPSLNDLFLGVLCCCSLFAWGVGIQVLAKLLFPRHKVSLCSAFPLGVAISIPMLAAITFLPNPKACCWVWNMFSIIALWGSIPVLRLDYKRLWIGWTRGAKFIAVLGGIPFVLSLSILFQPQLNFDLLSYHLPIAQELAAGKLMGLSEFDYYRNLPLSPMLLYMPALSDPERTVDDPGVRVILWFAWLATALAAGRLAGVLGGRRREQALAFLLVAYSEMFISGLLNSNSDVLTACVSVAGLGYLFTGVQGNKRLHAVAGGLLIGASYGLKQSAFAILLIPVLILLAGLVIVNRKQWTKALQASALVAGGMLISLAPWLLRSLYLGKHPLYPLVGTSPVWKADQQAFLQEQHRIVSPLSSGHFQELFANLGIWEYPLSMVRFNQTTNQMDVTTLLPALIYPLVFVWLFHRKKRWSQAGALLVCALGYGAWCLVGEAPTRFMAPLLGILFALSAVIIGTAHPLITRRGLWIFAGAVVALNCWRAVGTNVNGQPGNARLGWYSEAWNRDSVFPEEIIKLQHEFQHIPSGRTWLIGESRDRWFSPPVASNKVWNPLPYFGDATITSVEQLVSILEADRVNLIIVNDNELRRYVQFYGKDKTSVGDTGIRSSKEAYGRLLSNYPPVQFSGMTDEEIRVFVDFLRLCRFQALRTLQTGANTEIWISPLPTLESNSTTP